MRIAWGSCDGLFTPEPLAPVEEVAAQLGEPFDADAPRSAFFAAVLDALASEPTLVIVEDVHWADEATLDFLRYVGRRLDRTLLAHRRDLPRRRARAPASAAHWASATSISPPDCAPPAHTGRSPQARRRLRARPRRALPSDQATRSSSRRCWPRVRPVPSSVRDAVLARAARLDASARGRSTLPQSWARPSTFGCSSGCAQSAPSGIDECLASGVLRPRAADSASATSSRVAPSKRRSTRSLRAQLHGSVLESLAAGGTADHARLAHHAEAAGDGEAVLRYAHGAAEHAT